MQTVRCLLLVSLTLLAVAVLAGCTSRSKARAEARAAFESGQNRAFMEVGARQNGVSFRGPVVNPVIPWAEGITLGQAMAAAGWRHPSDPQIVIISRGSDTFEMTAQEALAAAEFQLHQGDLVEMHP